MDVLDFDLGVEDNGVDIVASSGKTLPYDQVGIALCSHKRFDPNQNPGAPRKRVKLERDLESAAESNHSQGDKHNFSYLC